MPQVNIEVDTKRVDAALEATPRKTGIGILRALKRGTNAAKTTATRAVAKDMGLKASDVRGRIRIKPATAQTLTGELRADLARISLIKFGARATRRGVTYRGKGGRKRHPHAFITDLSTGAGVFERKTSKRLPIRKLYGASIGHVFYEHRAEIIARGEEQFLAELDHQLDRILGA